MTSRIITQFASDVKKTYDTGIAREGSYRLAIGTLFSGLGPNINAVNEARRIECGAPDFIVSRGDYVVGHVEAKDIGIDLRNMKGENKKQQERYRGALPNLIYTNCYEWDFYRDGDLVNSASLESDGKKLESLLREFISHKPKSITSSKELAERMAGKATMIKNVLQRILRNNEEACSELLSQYKMFKENLMHSIDPDEFADIYAETIAYGMFAARINDSDSGKFLRRDVYDLLPKNNPFLRNLFLWITGPTLDSTIAWIIDDLADLFSVCDVKNLIDEFDKISGKEDPFLHFYETFLAAYNPKQRTNCGVWYTPQPAVNFIVRAVDQVLQEEFGLADGLADTSKIEVERETNEQGDHGKPIKERVEVHKVRILDPAVGTGTFLVQVIKQIAPKVKEMASSAWSQYVENDLIPRLHGFELRMAPYAMCFAKIDMVLKSFDYKPSKNPGRLEVYLNNSLEEGTVEVKDLGFAHWFSSEARGASAIKRDMPIMCVIGNPPYKAKTPAPKGWIGRMLQDYKMEPGGMLKLKERNPRWINDLYMQFLRLSSYLVEKNQEGIIGLVTNNGYLDNVTFRGARWHLQTTFDKIWIVDLHGSANKKETLSDGSPDENIFDIKQGVSIIIAVKTKSGKKKKNELATIMHADIQGSRKFKYDFLNTASISNSEFKPLVSMKPWYFMTKADYTFSDNYFDGFGIDEMMPVNGVAIATGMDHLTIDESKKKLKQRLLDFAHIPTEDARKKYKLKNDSGSFNLDEIQNDVKHLDESLFMKINYRPFDTRWIYYNGKSNSIVERPRKVMKHMLIENNIAIVVSKSIRGDGGFNHIFCHNNLSECGLISSVTSEGSYIFPLTIGSGEKGLIDSNADNFDMNLYARISNLAKCKNRGSPSGLDVLNYIYGVLHCVAYRSIYEEFLKNGFPRIPWPKSSDEFWSVSDKGDYLRELHLMEGEVTGGSSHPLCGDGDRRVSEIPKFRDNRIHINSDQYFSEVPNEVWEFRIGSYKPAQRWIKDRKDRVLSWNEIRHYQEILSILTETHRTMQTIVIDLPSK